MDCPVKPGNDNAGSEMKLRANVTVDLETLPAKATVDAGLQLKKPDKMSGFDSREWIGSGTSGRFIADVPLLLIWDQSRYHCVRDTMEIQIPREKHIDAPVAELRLQAGPHAKSDYSLAVRERAKHILVIVMMRPRVFMLLPGQTALMIAPTRVRTAFDFDRPIVLQIEDDEFAGASGVAREVLTVIAWQGNTHRSARIKMSRRAGRETFATGDWKESCILRDSARESEELQRLTPSEPPRATTGH